MGRLIISARYWNDMDLLQASLNQIDYWDADVVYLSEGAWDQDFEARSTDGTRGMLEDYAKDKKNVHVIDNIRENKNYRINQANTSNLVMELAHWQPNDWMMIVDVDHFYKKADIDCVKKAMKDGCRFDYFVHKVNNFLYDLQNCQETTEKTQSRLPTRLIEGCYWVKTNHLTLNGVFYSKAEKIRRTFLCNVEGLHYEGLRPSSRLTLRYSVGDRKTFWEFRNGSRVKSIIPFNGNPMSEFVVDHFKGYCIFPEGALKYVKLQTNGNVMQYHNPPEIEGVRKYFEDKSPKSVLELGCGLGRSSVGFYKAFPSWEKTFFHLLDGDTGEKQVSGIRNSSSDDYYNRLQSTHNYCRTNGIPLEQICLLYAKKPDVFSALGNIKFDFVYSFLAIGFHWPISLYLDRLLPYLCSGSILYFGIRPAKAKKYENFNKCQIDSIPDGFEIEEITLKGDYDSRLVLRKK